MIKAWEKERQAEIRAKRERDRALGQKRQQAAIRAQERVDAGQCDPIQAYNDSCPIEVALTMYGYQGKGGKFLSPNSESGTPGVVVKGEKAFSHHSSDSGIGKPCSDGVVFDSFDLFCHYEHGGDYNRAVQAAGDRFTIHDQVKGDTVTLTKYNQRQYMQQQAQSQQQTEPKPKEKAVDKQPFDMAQFSLTGLSAEMEKKMLEDRFILGRMAIFGQSTAFYAKPNTGKTLIIIKLISEAIASGEINGKDVFYINADDTYKGIIYKTKIAEKYNFQMIAPSHKGANGEIFKSERLAFYLKSLIDTDQAKGKIFILDTVKKFTDLMSKKDCSNFGEGIRQFVSHGGSVIMLAHANKYRDDDRQIVYSGTTDLVDDADCAYTIDVIQDDPHGMRTVKFKNFKSRGDVALEAFYQYDYQPGTSYFDRLDSVTTIDEDERKKAIQQQKLTDQLTRNKIAIEVIIECINEGITGKTALIAEAHAKSDLSKAKIRKALEEHTGPEKSKNQFWHIEPGDKNSSVYRLNYGV